MKRVVPALLTRGAPTARQRRRSSRSRRARRSRRRAPPPPRRPPRSRSPPPARELDRDSLRRLRPGEEAAGRPAPRQRLRLHLATVAAQLVTGRLHVVDLDRDVLDTRLGPTEPAAARFVIAELDKLD